MTEAQFRQMLEEAIERKLIELLGDPDEGLTFKKAVRARLLRQRRKVAEGERGMPLQDVVKRLDL